MTHGKRMFVFTAAVFAAAVCCAAEPVVTYALLRSPTVAPRTSYTTEVARAVADAETMTLSDETPDRPISQAFYIVEAR